MMTLIFVDATDTPMPAIKGWYVPKNDGVGAKLFDHLLYGTFVMDGATRRVLLAHDALEHDSFDGGWNFFVDRELQNVNTRYTENMRFGGSTVSSIMFDLLLPVHDECYAEISFNCNGWQVTMGDNTNTFGEFPIERIDSATKNFTLSADLTKVDIDSAEA